MKNNLIVRAVDVGYGHVKYSLGRNEAGAIHCDRFPSLSPAVQDDVDFGNYMLKRNTFVVTIEGRHYEVGKDVISALDPNSEGSVMDLEFAMSVAYRARLYGALNYISQDLPGDVLDVLILGLPLNTFTKYQTSLAERFTGEHIINAKGTKLQVRHCEIYPQPFGSYARYLENQRIADFPVALVVDIGYNTFDWLVCKHKTPRLHGTSMRGMASVINAMAKEVIRATNSNSTESAVMRRIDEALITGTPFTMYGKPVKLDKAQKLGEAIIEEAAQSVKNAVQDAGEIDLIIVAGGGAPYYKDAIRKKFRSHEVRLLDDPSFGNVRGFHIIGESLARSMSRAVSLVAAA